MSTVVNCFLERIIFIEQTQTSCSWKLGWRCRLLECVVAGVTSTRLITENGKIFYWLAYAGYLLSFFLNKTLVIVPFSLSKHSLYMGFVLSAILSTACSFIHSLFRTFFFIRLKKNICSYVYIYFFNFLYRVIFVFSSFFDSFILSFIYLIVFYMVLLYLHFFSFFNSSVKLFFIPNIFLRFYLFVDLSLPCYFLSSFFLSFFLFDSIFNSFFLFLSFILL